MFLIYDAQTMIYASMKYVNGAAVLAEFRFAAAESVALAIKTRMVEVIPGTQQALTQILQGQA